MKIFLYGILLTGLYYSTVIQMKSRWRLPEFNYCYLIPFVVLYLIWERRDRLATIPSEPSWKGIIPLALGLAFFWLGELGGEYFTLYLSVWLVVIGLCWMHLGWKKLKVIGFALIFILTMFPPPYFINIRLMLTLRLISSKLGVFLIQLYGLPVTREGNIIDLGFAQLQVVEACSGLNSLISLLVLSLLLAYFFKAHLWKRCVVVLSSIPLAIFTNSLRIAVTAILFRHFGSEVAQGFFHGFSGLLIFLLCVPLLVIEIKILAKLPPVKRISSANSTENRTLIGSPHQRERGIFHSKVMFQPVFIVAVLLLGVTLALSQGVDFREKIPANKSVAQFPLEIGEWKAKKREKIDPIFLDRLDLSEYIMMDYENRAAKSINFYVAYYESQSKGKSIHTPASCLPGQGWTFDQSGSVSIPGLQQQTGIPKVNRAVIQYGNSRQIAYYWFSLRGRILRNMYQVKIYNFWDALTMQRTDGALIRLITPVYENEDLSDVDTRLQDFLQELVPVLEEYIPGEKIERRS
jgi:exosortase D (VPLPA-CTERM-specific)